MTLNDYTSQPTPALVALLEDPQLASVVMQMIKAEDHAIQFQACVCLLLLLSLSLPLLLSYGS